MDGPAQPEERQAAPSGLLTLSPAVPSLRGLLRGFRRPRLLPALSKGAEWKPRWVRPRCR